MPNSANRKYGSKPNWSIDASPHEPLIHNHGVYTGYRNR